MGGFAKKLNSWAGMTGAKGPGFCAICGHLLAHPYKLRRVEGGTTAHLPHQPHKSVTKNSREYFPHGSQCHGTTVGHWDREFTLNRYE